MLAGAGVLLVAVALWMVVPREHEQSLAEKLGITSSERLRCEPESGMSAVYRVRLHSKVKLNAAALLADGPKQKQSPMVSSEAGFAGRLRVHAVEARKGGMFMALALDEITTSAGTPELASDSLAELSMPFYGVLARDCSWGEFAFGQSVSADVVNRTQALMQGLSLALDQDPKKSAWTSREHDAVGQYAARYERDAEQAKRVAKVRQSYLKAHPNTGFAFKEQLIARVLESNTPITLDDDYAWLAHLDSREHLQITRVNGTLVADLQSTLSLTWTDADAEPIALARTDADLRWRKPSDPPLVGEPRKPEPPDEMKTMPLELALAQYAALMRSNEHGALDRAADYLALYLRARPEMALELMRLLERQAVPPDLEGTLFLALERAGTTQARDALIMGLSDAHATRNRARAAAALPDVPKPGIETLDALADTARTAKASNADETTLVRNAASYAIGTLEQRTRTAHPAVARQARAELQASLARAQGDQQRAAALDAIGNSGASSLLEDIKPLMRSEEALVRSHAIQAMGHMDPAANQDLFKSLIANEKDPQIRGAIAVTYSEQAARSNQPPPNLVVDAAIEHLGAEPDPRVRGLLIELIGPACKNADARALPALAMQFQRETDPDLLRLIGKYVPGDKLR